jgi:hypothetical protein
VVWQDDTPGNNEVFYKKSTNGGMAWSGAKRLTWNSGDSEFPAAATDSNDNIHLVWRYGSIGNGEIYYKRGNQLVEPTDR